MSGLTVRVDGRRVQVAAGTSVAAAVARAGATRFRSSVLGEPRWPVCGMGICYECRVTLDGRPHVRSCMVRCEAGMEITTDGA